MIALATAIHEVEHVILGGLDSCGLLDWLGKSIIVDCCGNIDQTEQHSQEALKTLLFAKHGFSQGASCERVGQIRPARTCFTHGQIGFHGQSHGVLPDQRHLQHI